MHAILEADSTLYLIIAVSCVLSLCCVIIGFRMTPESSKETKLNTPCVWALGLPPAGMFGGMILLQALSNYDFPRDYGQLIRSHEKEVSFDMGRKDLRSERFVGEILVCTEYGEKYPMPHALPNQLLAHSRAEVKDLVFVGTESSIVGSYGPNSRTDAVRYTLTACAIDVATGKIIASFRTVGSPPIVISQGVGHSDNPNELAYQSPQSALQDWLEGNQYSP